MGTEMLLSARAIEKRYGATPVLRGVDFELKSGEIHALLGGNGAGKSTLIRIVTGTTDRDSGVVEWNSQRSAKKPVIGVVHQELALLPDLTVAENIAISHDHRPFSLIDRSTRRTTAHAALSQIDQSLADRILDQPARSLSLHEGQVVEIARALSLGSEILLMDEPTANLTSAETSVLFALLKRLAAQEGMAVVFVSHRMKEIRMLCDRCTIIRDGRTVVNGSPLSDLTDTQIVQFMGQHSHDDKRPARRTASGDASGDFSLVGPEGVKIDVPKGTILGLAGAPVGPGKLIGDLVGDGDKTWSIACKGMPEAFFNPAQAVRNGVGYVSGDRAGRGILGELPLVDNIVAATRVFYRSLIAGQRELDQAHRRITDLNLKSGSVWEKPRSLSGGNQQKLLLSRWLDVPMKLFVLEEPTRGVDIGTKQEIYAIMRAMAASGVTVVWYSTENAELLELCDDIFAFDTDGKPVGALLDQSFDEDGLANLTGMAA